MIWQKHEEKNNPKFFFLNAIEAVTNHKHGAKLV
jgi:hypothetical protein